MGAINAVTDLTAQGDVAVLTVNSPPVNALSQQVRDGIVKGMQQAIADAAVKAVVLICDGRTFIAGADITEFGKPPQAPSLHDVVRHDREFAQAGRSPRFTAPRSAAAWKSRCAATIASPCRRRSAACPKCISVCCPAQAARSACRASSVPSRRCEMVTSGKHVDAKTAHAAGLIDEIVPEGELRAGAIAFAKKVVAEKRPLQQSARHERQGRSRARQAGDLRRVPQGQCAQVPRLPRARIQHPLHRSGGEPAVRRRHRRPSASCSWS